MLTSALAFALLAVNPVGGLWLAIPFALYKLRYPVWLTLAFGVPLAYVQVLVVDYGWTLMARWSWWLQLLERRRSPRVEKLMAARGAFWTTVVLAPLIGPWQIMAFMRYAQVPQRRVALPILLGLLWIGAVIAAGCIHLPHLFGHWNPR
jgi:hypothetical protein